MIDHVPVTEHSHRLDSQSATYDPLGARAAASENYRQHLKSYLHKQLSSQSYSYGSKHAVMSTKYSRVFKEKQNARLFKQLQSLKGSYGSTYEQIRSMHMDLAPRRFDAVNPSGPPL